ncbi:MAG: ATP-binding protein [Clostridia bacterium]|nr:ATP-binding protein [Clostridia bacterium]
MFIGRKNELNFLNSAYNSNKAEFIALYGRRRVGKTELLNEFCKDKNAIFYSSSETTDLIQLQAFSKALISYDEKAFPFVDRFKDWETAFSAILTLSENKKLIVVIDEFPYMVKSNKSIPSILQNLWDHKLKNSKIMLIISGSSMSFIENEVLGYKNPLYGRATGIYKLEPLSFWEATEFFPNYSDEDKVIAFAILGGIPHYLQQFDKDLSLEDNIKNTILKRGSVLYNEVDFLLHEELREPAVYNAIIEAIALGNTTHNDIYMKTQIEKRILSVYIKNLIDLGIIKREFSVLSPLNDRTNSSKGNYYLVDNLFRFWYAFCNPNISTLESGRIDLLWKHLIFPELHNFASKSFETICINYLLKLNGKEQLPFWFSNIGRWWGKITRTDNDGNKTTSSEEIDILAFDKTENNYILGECKFRNEKFDIAEFKKLKEKIALKGNIYYYLFALSGFTDAIKQESITKSNLKLITLSNILE